MMDVYLPRALTQEGKEFCVCMNWGKNAAGGGGVAGRTVETFNDFSGRQWRKALVKFTIFNLKLV